MLFKFRDSEDYLEINPDGDAVLEYDGCMLTFNHDEAAQLYDALWVYLKEVDLSKEKQVANLRNVGGL